MKKLQVHMQHNYSVEILIMVVLGGMGSITGSIVAAIVLTLLPELLRGFSEYRMLIYSVILICVMLFKPSGLLGQHELSLTKILNKFRGKKAVTREQLDARGMNHSSLHEDVMIGAEDSEITGKCRDGRVVQLFQNGVWVL